MIHQPSGGASGQASDVKIHAEHIIETRRRLNEILASRTGQSVERIAVDTERDNFMSPDAALEYGIIDEIVKPRR